MLGMVTPRTLLILGCKGQRSRSLGSTSPHNKLLNISPQRRGLVQCLCLFSSVVTDTRFPMSLKFGLKKNKKPFIFFYFYFFKSASPLLDLLPLSVDILALSFLHALLWVHPRHSCFSRPITQLQYMMLGLWFHLPEFIPAYPPSHTIVKQQWLLLTCGQLLGICRYYGSKSNSHLASFTFLNSLFNSHFKYWKILWHNNNNCPLSKF